MKYIGVQTFGLKKELTEDFEGTLKRLKELGINGIEPLILFREEQGDQPKNKWALETLRKSKKILDSLDMKLLSLHCSIDVTPENTEEDIAEQMLSLHRELGVDTFVASGLIDTASEACALGKRFAIIGPILEKAGCRLLFHNHNDELHKGEGCGDKSALDIILEHAAPDMMLQLDIGWAGFEEDELAITEKYKNRIYSIHLKDFNPKYAKNGYTRQQLPKEAFYPIGEGVIRLQDALRKIPEFPNFCETLIIDQDHHEGDMMEALRISLQNLHAWGYQIER